MGKSLLAKNTLHYVADRKLFTGGIIFIDMNTQRYNFSLVKDIMGAIMKGLSLNDQ